MHTASMAYFAFPTAVHDQRCVECTTCLCNVHVLCVMPDCAGPCQCCLCLIKGMLSHPIRVYAPHKSADLHLFLVLCTLPVSKPCLCPSMPFMCVVCQFGYCRLISRALNMRCAYVQSQLSCVMFQEVALIGMLAYLSYLCGDWLGLSGIVALFCCAVTISHYALHNVSSLSRVTTVSAFQTLSYVSEGAIFIYVGMDTLDPLKWQVGGSL